jgi:hypothetical protein
MRGQLGTSILAARTCFVDAMLADLKSKHCVDPARVRRRHVKWRLLRQLTAVLSARGIQGSGTGGRRRATVSLR